MMVKLHEIPDLSDMRNKLVLDCKLEPEEQRAGYVNGVLDMYNEAKKRQEQLLAVGKEMDNEHNSTAEQKSRN